MLTITFNPTFASGQDLISFYNYNKPTTLTKEYVDFMKIASNGRVNYQVIREDVVNDFVPLIAGQTKFNETTYKACMTDKKKCNPQASFDYAGFINANKICDKFNTGEIDEVWFFAGPWFGFHESSLTGKNSYWMNSYPIEGTNCGKPLPLMGFNYERLTSLMVEDFMHRAEATMIKVYGKWESINLISNWDKFTQINYYTKKGFNACGGGHFTPNSSTEYEYTSERSVSVSYTHLTLPTIYSV